MKFKFLTLQIVYFSVAMLIFIKYLLIAMILSLVPSMTLFIALTLVLSPRRREKVIRAIYSSKIIDHKIIRIKSNDGIVFVKQLFVNEKIVPEEIRNKAVFLFWFSSDITDPHVMYWIYKNCHFEGNIDMQCGS